MQKDYMKAIEETKKTMNKDYEPDMITLQAIMNQSEDNYDLLYYAFVYGYLKGGRAMKRGVWKK
jgi:hypothetical protein